MRKTARVITMGVDLAAQPKKTAVCRLLWGDDRSVSVFSLGHGFDDHRLLEMFSDVDAVGIDAPFGFPRDAVRAQSNYAAGGAFTRRPADVSPEQWSLLLRYRATDRFVHSMLLEVRDAKIWPLSVSSDRIATCAWRCAALLSQIADGSDRGPVRSGGDFYEVYPAATLAWWGLPYKGYKPGASGSAKSVGAVEIRARILERLRTGLGDRLELTEDESAKLRSDDDLLDAFIASLTTRAAATGATHSPPADCLELAKEEGWIHIPTGSLVAL